MKRTKQCVYRIGTLAIWLTFVQENKLFLPFYLHRSIGGCGLFKTKAVIFQQHHEHPLSVYDINTKKTQIYQSQEISGVTIGSLYSLGSLGAFFLEFLSVGVMHYYIYCRCVHTNREKINITYIYLLQNTYSWRS